MFAGAVFLGLALIQTSAPVTGTAATLPSDLPSLATILPHLVESKTMDFGLYSDAVTKAIESQPGSIPVALPIFDKDLKEPNQQVQFDTLAILQVLATRSDAVQLLSPLFDDMISSINNGDQYTKSIALLTVGNLGRQAPNGFVGPIQHVLSDPGSPDQLLAASAETLLRIRPVDANIQRCVVNLINDTTRSIKLRSAVLVSVATPASGPSVVDAVAQIANKPVATAAERQLRDSALVASGRIGRPAVSLIEDRLKAIMADPGEPLNTHRLAHDLLTQVR